MDTTAVCPHPCLDLLAVRSATLLGPVPRSTAFIALNDGPGHYQELEEPIEAADPSTAAQRAIEQSAIHPDDQVPVILIVEERHVSVFSRDDDGQAVTPDEDFPRLLAKRPQAAYVYPTSPDESDPEGRGAGRTSPGPRSPLAVVSLFLPTLVRHDAQVRAVLPLVEPAVDGAALPRTIGGPGGGPEAGAASSLTGR